MATTPPRLPPLPQADPISARDGRLTLPWNMFFVELLRYIQSNTNAIDAFELTGGAGGGSVATGGAGPSVDLSALPSAEGVANLPSRADHTHQRAIQAEEDGVDFGAVQAINVEGPIAEVYVEPNLTGSLLTDLYGYWRLDEEDGTRARTLGTGPDLSEVGGTITAVTGRFGNAVPSVYTSTKSLRGTVTGVDFTAGITIAFWTKLATSPASVVSPFFSLYDSVSGDYLLVYRFYNSDYLDFGASIGGDVFLMLPGFRLGPLDTTQWHLIVAWIDPADGIAHIEADGGAISRSVATTVDLSVFTPDTLNLLGKYAAFDAGHCDLDAPMLWTRPLTVSERALLWTSSRMNISVNHAAMELFGGF